jgi:hypothetical protein
MLLNLRDKTDQTDRDIVVSSVYMYESTFTTRNPPQISTHVEILSISVTSKNTSYNLKFIPIHFPFPTVTK